MLINKAVRSVAVCCAGLILLTGCGSGDSSSDSAGSDVSAAKDVFAMDTFMTLKAYGPDAEPALDAAADRIAELEKTLSVTDKSSDIWRLNSSAGQPVEVSSDTMTILQKAAEVYDKTGGALNICLYPVLRAWGFTTSEYRIPGDEELRELLENTDCRKVVLDGMTAELPADYQVDLGALAKGYTGDEIMETLRENGVDSAIISLGGNVQSLGTKPDGSLWKVSVRDPFSPDTDMCVVEIGEKAVITSGNYERYFTGEDGNVYWHIIDGADGYPADNGLVSVTVIGDCGLDCDALSTALFVEGYPDACEQWRKSRDFEMILVTDDGKIYYTEGLSGSFTNISSMPAEVIPDA